MNTKILIYIDQKWKYSILDCIKYLHKDIKIFLYVEGITLKKYIQDNYSKWISGIFCIEEEHLKLKKNKSSLNKKKQKNLQMSLGCSISKIYVSEFLYSEIFSNDIKDIHEYSQITYLNFQIIKTILNKSKPDFIFLENTSGYFSKLLTIVSKNLNKKINIFVFYELYFKNKFIFVDENEKSLFLEHFYKKNTSNFSSTKNFLKKFSKSNDKFSPVESLAIKPTKKNLLDVFKDFYKIKNLNLFKLKTYFKRLYLNNKLINYKDLEFHNYDKYVVYYLSYQPEAASYGNSFYSFNQIEIIKYISMFLPSDVKLIVKEHKANTVDSLNNINKILKLKKNYPNIYLAKFDILSKSLIKNSLCTITLSGTVGVESIFLKKPVITIGNIFYNFYENVYKVNSFQHLEVVIFNLYKNNFKFIGDNLKITQSIIDAYQDGDIMKQNIDLSNSKNISKGIEKIISFIKIQV